MPSELTRTRFPSGERRALVTEVAYAGVSGEVMQEARTSGEQLSKLDEFSEAERSQLFEMIGLAALKYFILKVDAKKRMLFDPAASIFLKLRLLHPLIAIATAVWLLFHATRSVSRRPEVSPAAWTLIGLLGAGGHLGDARTQTRKVAQLRGVVLEAGSRKVLGSAIDGGAADSVRHRGCAD